ncbi:MULTISPECIES: hypothetical protein [unclassified Brenneria]|uniref:hypothetical protein n=1 Tax=unclassified Brenneria TaxID=2634434 RepID=UPI0029C59952|nr:MULTISPECIES: hypothetical protein [unclassified Brenneria]MDX5628738.1 hypothetical protein [Brenneria sp. L3-3Z]MDX5695877.1 hypothetical protein [Brenneria sp. L4-2C]
MAQTMGDMAGMPPKSEYQVIFERNIKVLITEWLIYVRDLILPFVSKKEGLERGFAMLDISFFDKIQNPLSLF